MTPMHNVSHFTGEALLLRAVFAAMTSLLMSLFLGKPLIKWLQRQQLGQVVRTDGPKSHFDKSGTPTMGGVLIILSILIGSLIWSQWTNPLLWVVLFVLISFGAIGWVDDYLKVVRKNPKGLAVKWKFFWLSVCALVAAWSLEIILGHAHRAVLLIPFDESHWFPLSGWVLGLGYLVLVSSSNAVNLTDGLDGLAVINIILVVLGLMVYALVQSHGDFAHWFRKPFIPDAAVMVIVGASVVGACIGFLWFNAYPAQVFMGDVGALSLGGVIGVMALSVRQELLLLIMGGLFVVEALSVILQVGSYKLRKKRIFKMAPIHHHFELSGWAEPKVVTRFSIITLFLVLIGLANLFF